MNFILNDQTDRRRSWTLNLASTNPLALLDPTAEAVVADAGVADATATVETAKAVSVVNAETVAIVVEVSER